MKKHYTAPELESQLLSVKDVIMYSILGGKDPSKDDVIDDLEPGNDPAKKDIIEIV